MRKIAAILSEMHKQSKCLCWRGETITWPSNYFDQNSYQTCSGFEVVETYFKKIKLYELKENFVNVTKDKWNTTSF